MELIRSLLIEFELFPSRLVRAPQRAYAALQDHPALDGRMPRARLAGELKRERRRRWMWRGGGVGSVCGCVQVVGPRIVNMTHPQTAAMLNLVASDGAHNAQIIVVSFIELQEHRSLHFLRECTLDHMRKILLNTVRKPCAPPLILGIQS